VRRRIGALVILQVTGHARRIDFRVLPVRVTCLALQLGVRPGQRKSGFRMIEDRVRPRRRVVANRAIGREPCLRVIRVRRFLIILQVAGAAVFRNIRVVVVYVTTGAGRVYVGSSQREPGECAMIEVHLQPRGHVVARRTGRGERQLHVVGIVRSHVIFHVAADAVRWCALVFPAHVTLRALQVGVSSQECEPGKFQVIELRAQPCIHVAVALLALGWEVQGNVARTRGLLELIEVTTHAVSGQPLELPHRGSLVAVVALQRRMCPDQRETILMRLDLAHPDAPAFHRVTLLARRPKLTPVNVGVAVSTLHPHIREHQVGVALPASDFLVHAAQRIFRLVMIELGDVADGLPPGKRMAVLTGDRKIAVRTPRGHIRARAVGSPGWGRSGSLWCGRGKHRHPHDDVEDQGREHVQSNYNVRIELTLPWRDAASTRSAIRCPDTLQNDSQA